MIWVQRYDISDKLTVFTHKKNAEFVIFPLMRALISQILCTFACDKHYYMQLQISVC